MRTAVILLIALSWSFKAFSYRSDEKALPRMKIVTANLSSETNRKGNSTWTERLKKDLLLNYDKYARPTELKNTTDVNIDINIRHIEMDEQRSIMTVHAWLRLHWTDEKLKWNSDDYSGLTNIKLAYHEVWQPDIYPYNGIAGGTTDFGITNYQVNDNGTVTWIPPVTFQVYCEMDMTHWPFDTQACPIILGSSSYTENEVDLILSPEFGQVEDVLIRNPEWKFVKIEKKKQTSYYCACAFPYVDVTYYITVQRQSATYLALLITPVTALIIMALSVFLIPPVSTDKIILCGTTIIINCLFLLYFTQKLPILAGNTPVIVLFYSRTLYLLSFSLIVSVIVINIAKNPKYSPLPWSIKKLLTGCLGKCLLINTLKCKDEPKSISNSSEVSDNLPVLAEQKQQAECSNYQAFQQDWICLAVAIDRIAFLIYCFAFAILAITYSV